MNLRLPTIYKYLFLLNTMLKDILNKQIKLIRPNKSELLELRKLSKNFVDLLNEGMRKDEIEAEAFIGGSFAKGTLIKKETGYDIDIFVRFSWKYERLSEILKPILEKICKKEKLKLELLHGSRDYFRIFYNDKSVYFEVVPVTKIKKAHEERNVTDLSYFHVSYVKRKVKGYEDEVILAKSFFHAQKVYGAETY